MNWSAIAVFVTIGLAQSGLVVTLLDRLFRAEMKILYEAIDALKEELGYRREMDAIRDNRIDVLERHVQRIEDRLSHCLNEGCGN